MRRARSGNLTALLVVVSALEFIVNRLAGRLFFPRPALSSGGSGSNAIHAISWVGSWLFQLTALLALAVMVAAFIGLFRISDITLGVMANPFYIDMGFTKADIATISKFYGFWMSIGVK